jgi:hypothetical protein
MCSRAINNIKSIYNIFLYKKIKYYFPIIEKLVYASDKKISRYNIYKRYSNCEFIYKFQNVEYNNNIYFNLGLIYHTSNQNINYIIDKDLVFFEEDVDSIKITLQSSTSDNNYQLIDEKFVNSILNFSTKKSRLEPLLYYYLKKHLSNNDQIISVEFEINNKFISVDHLNRLEDIASAIEINN